MGKVVFDSLRKKNQTLSALIWGYLSIQGISIESAAERLGIKGLSKNTLRRRLQHPETFTVGELLTISKRIGIPIEEIRAAIKH